MIARLRSFLTHPAVVSWVVARAVVLAAQALAEYAHDDLGARPPAGRTTSGLLGWDAAWYVRIARHGYDSVSEEALRFFPLFPALGRAVGVLTGTRAGVLLVANAAALVAGFLMHRLVVDETGDRAIAARATWLLALFPASFVLVMGYAEALFLCLALATFLALRSQRWWAAALAGFAAGLTRPLGVVLAIPAVIEAFRRRPSAGRSVPNIAAAVAPIAGLATYLLWVQVRFGDWLLPLRLQSADARRGSFSDPASRLVEAGRDLAAGDRIGSGLHLPWAVAAIVLVVVLLARWPASYGLFAAAVVAVALSADNLDSFERYALSAFPLIAAAAALAKPVWIERPVYALSSAGLAAYAVLAFLGAYVP